MDRDVLIHHRLAQRARIGQKRHMYKWALGIAAALVSVNALAQEAITARVENGKLKYGTQEQAIPLADIDAANVRVTSVGKLTWVHVPSHGAASWDAVLAPGRSSPIDAELTGKTHGQPGSMSGTKIEAINGYVARGSVSEDFTICDREALASTEVIDPKTLDWTGASFQQLTNDEIGKSPVVTATPRQDAAPKALAPLLLARFSSSGAHPSAMTDGDTSTVWSEGAPGGSGRGQFVVFGAPSEIPISKLAITFAPPKPDANGAAPKRFFLATRDKLFTVNVPEDAWKQPGRAYDIALPEPVKSSCMALVLEDAYPSAKSPPDVSIAEITAYSELDGPDASLEKVALDLGAGGRPAQIAEAILKRAGNSALPAIEAAWPKLDVVGRTRAMDAAEGASCGAPATRVFLNGLCERDANIHRKATHALEVCIKTSDIVTAVQTMAQPLCKDVPLEVALLGKQGALPKLGDWMATNDVEMRATARHAFATATREATAQMLAAMANDAQKTPFVRLEMLRAMGGRVREIAPDASKTLDALLVPNADLATRYLALEPLTELARAGDRSSQTRVASMLAHDPEWPVRAHAAELARDLPSAQSELMTAIDDKEPRVRQAALDTIAELRSSPAAVLVEKRLENDAWTFVRVAAARAMGAMPAARDLDKALATQLGTDQAPQVRGALIDALALHQAREYASAVRERLDDAQEIPLVRTAAARALGAMCDPAQLERLTELARAAADPMASGEDLTLGLAAIAALGDIHPADLATRLAKLRDNSVRDAVRAAADHALASPARCAKQ
jgi:HEAT repeat protein